MSKKKSIVTNATRLLKAEKVDFETIEYEAESVGENFGVTIAELTGIPCDQCFKTLIVKGKEIAVLCIPVHKEADLKKVAQLMGEKKVEMLPTKELLAVSGYIRGSVSPIGMKKKYKTFINESCLQYDKITVSGGVCGLSVLLNPRELIEVCNASAADIIKD